MDDSLRSLEAAAIRSDDRVYAMLLEQIGERCRSSGIVIRENANRE